MAEQTRDVLEGLEGYTPGPWEAGAKPYRLRNGEGANFSDGDWEVFPPIGEAGPVAVAPSEEIARLIARAPELVEEVRELRRALEELVKLQSHYAQLLNQWDGGRRRLFTGAEEWIARVRELDGEVAHG